MTNENSRLVVKDNALIRASYKLTLNEQRLVLTCIARLDSMRGTLPKDNIFQVTVDDFQEQWGLPRPKAYQALAEASDALYERDIKLRDSTGKARMRWVYYVKYHNNQGRVDLGFSPTVAPYLTQLRREFTSYGLDSVSGLKSAYSIRVFELLMQFKSTGVCHVGVDELRFALDLGDRYPRFTDLKKRVIDPAVKELSQKSNLDVQYDVHRKSNVAFAITFFFAENPQGVLGLDTPPQPRRRPRFLTKDQAAKKGRPGENWSDLLERLKRDGFQLVPPTE